MKTKRLLASLLASGMLLMTACGNSTAEDSSSNGAAAAEETSTTSAAANDEPEETTAAEAVTTEAVTTTEAEEVTEAQTPESAELDTYSTICAYISANGTESFDVEGFSALLVDELGLTVDRNVSDVETFNEQGEKVEATRYEWGSVIAPFGSVKITDVDREVQGYDLDSMGYVALIDDIPFNHVYFSVEKSTGKLLNTAMELRFDAYYEDELVKPVIRDIKKKLEEKYGYEFDEYNIARGEYGSIILIASSYASLYLGGN